MGNLNNDDYYYNKLGLFFMKRALQGRYWHQVQPYLFTKETHFCFSYGKAMLAITYE